MVPEPGKIERSGDSPFDRLTIPWGEGGRRGNKGPKKSEEIVLADAVPLLLTSSARGSQQDHITSYGAEDQLQPANQAVVSTIS